MFTNYTGKKMKTVLFSIAVMFSMSTTAVAIPMDINFSVTGVGTGSGLFVVDSSLLAPNKQTLANISQAVSLDLAIDFGSGSTQFVLSDMDSKYFALDMSSAGNIEDLNLWATNFDGYNLSGRAAFRGNVLENQVALGQVVYTIESVTEHGVPEPSIALLLASGLMVFGVVRRKRKA